MIRNQSSLGLAVFLSAGLNALLLLAIAWVLAVSQGLAIFQPPPPAALVAAAVEEISPEISVVVTTVAAAEPAVAPPEKRYIQAPEDQPETAPDKASRFYSSRNMRAASEQAPDAAGAEGLATKDGIDVPFLDLRDADFQDGERNRAEAAAAATGAEAQTAKEANDGQAQENPPEPDRRKLTETSAIAGAKPPETPEIPEPSESDSPPEPENRERDPLPRSKIAFRDTGAENPALLETPPDPARPPAKRPPPETARRTPPRSQNQPPLTRIPDRVPETDYRAGQRKAKSLGTITNREDTSSVDALATAEGKFGKILRTVIEKNWHRRRLTLGGLMNRGLVEVEFEVDSRGRVSNVRLANPGDANPVMQDCALTAVINAKLPPPPRELFPASDSGLTGGKMQLSFSFLIY